MIDQTHTEQVIEDFDHCQSLCSLREIETLTGFNFKRIKKKMGHLKPQKIEGPIHYICDVLEELAHCDIRAIPEPTLFDDPRDPVNIEATT